MEVLNYIDRVTSGKPARFGFDSTLKRLQALTETVDYGRVDGELFEASICKFLKTPGNEECLAVANEDGYIRIQNTENDEIKTDIEFKAHNNTIYDLEWSECQNRLIVGSADQTASMWDVCEGSVTKIKEFLAHDMSVRSVTFRPLDKDVFATGARDGRIVIWDVRTASSDVAEIHVKPENLINKVPPGNGGIVHRNKQHQAAHSICSLLFQDSVHLFCSSISESCIDVWDLRKNYSFLKRVPSPLYKLTHPDPGYRSYYTSMCLDSTCTRLYTNSREGSLHCFNVASYSAEPVAKYTGHEVASNYIRCCLSADDRYLLSGSGGGQAHVWSTARPGPAIARLNAHSQLEVSYVDWSRSPMYKIATCSEDLRLNYNSTDETKAFPEQLMVWRVTDEREEDEREDEEGQSERKDEGIGSISWQELAQPVKRPRCHRACRPLVKPRPPITELNSPTVNLPNHVIDGTSPLHRCSPSSRKEKENRNWLSSLKKKTPSSLNSKSVQIKKARNSGHKPKACGNLLKFFKAAARVSSPLESLSEVGNFAESSLMNGVMEI